MMNPPNSEMHEYTARLSRRELFAASSLGLVGLGMRPLGDVRRAKSASTAKRSIILLLNGAPSQLDTFDPKPDSPAEIRGPFQPIATRVPGVHVTELFPRLAQRMDNVAIIRSVHHDGLANHETGLGQLMPGGGGVPRVEDALGDHLAPQDGVPPYRELSGTLPFGRRVRLATNLLEHGARLVVVPMFKTLLGTVTWDCHDLGGTLACTLDDYKATLGPQLDRVLAALLDDLTARGLLDDTLVLCMGEMGRAPRIGVRTQGGVGAGPNGRDHWTRVWSILAAGGGVQGGRVVGASDKLGAEPRERPVSPGEIAATAYDCLGIDFELRLADVGGNKTSSLLRKPRPITELF